MMERLRAFLANPFLHRLLAFALVLVGGGSAGRALRENPRIELLDFGALWSGAWIIRSGGETRWLYDPHLFPQAVEWIAPAGKAVDLGPSLPGVLFLTLPFTQFEALAGKLWFALAGLLIGLLGIMSLGAGRSLGWNRTEWMGFAGLVLLSTGTAETLLRGGPGLWILGLACFSVAALQLGRPWLGSLCAALVTNLHPIGVFLLLFQFRSDRWKSWLPGAVLGLGGVSAQLVWMGDEARRGWWRAVGEGWSLPPVFDSSIPAQVLRLSESSGLQVLSAALLFVVTGAFLFPRLRDWWKRQQPKGHGVELHPTIRPDVSSDPSSPSRQGQRERTSGRPFVDAPLRVEATLAMGLWLGLALLPLQFRGQSLLWALPLWMAWQTFERQRRVLFGLPLVLISALLLCPAPLGFQAGPAFAAKWTAIGAGLWMIWFWARRAGGRE